MNSTKSLKKRVNNSTSSSKNLFAILNNIKIGKTTGSVTYYTVTKRYNIHTDKVEDKISKFRQPIQKVIFEERTLGQVLDLFRDIKNDLKATYFKIN